MGFPKPYLKAGFMSFLERIVYSYYASGFQDIHVVINYRLLEPQWKDQWQPLQPMVNYIPNEEPEKGRLNSLRLATSLLGKHDFILLHNVDSPLTSFEVAAKLWKSKNPEGVTVPSYFGKKGHPVLLASPVIRRINQSLKKHKTLRDILTEFPEKEVPVEDPEILVNINTPEDYQMYFPEFEMV